MDSIIKQEAWNDSEESSLSHIVIKNEPGTSEVPVKQEDNFSYVSSISDRKDYLHKASSDSTVLVAEEKIILKTEYAENNNCDEKTMWTKTSWRGQNKLFINSPMPKANMETNEKATQCSALNTKEEKEGPSVFKTDGNHKHCSTVS